MSLALDRYYKTPSSIGRLRILPAVPARQRRFHKRVIGREVREQVIDRYFFPVIDQNDPNGGVKIWSTSKQVAMKVFDHILTPQEPVLSKWNIIGRIKRACRKLVNWWTGKETLGRDFIIKVENKHGFPDYSSSHFDPKPSLCGSAEQYKLWKDQGLELIKWVETGDIYPEESNS